MKTILVDAVGCLVSNTGEVFKEMYDLLETYPHRKIILTGADDEQMAEFGLNDIPYEVFTLKHTPEKTDPEYYKKMLNHFDLEASDVIYFEHNLEAVESAQSVGIKTYFFDGKKRDLHTLKKFIDSNI
jgi:HAD superfamily hydrolase (TIGR01509 family)